MWRVICVLGVIAFFGREVGATPSPPVEGVYPVRVGDETVFNLSEAHEKLSAAERATRAVRSIEQGLKESSSQVRVTPGPEVDVISLGSKSVAAISDADAQAAGVATRKDLAESIAVRLRQTVKVERKRQAIAEQVLRVSGVVLFGLLALLLIRLVGRMSKKITRLATRESGAVGAVRVHTLELLPASAAREVLRVSILGASWLIRLGLLYTWFLAALSLFPATRPLVGKATGYLFSPVLELLERFASRLPLLVALFIAFLAVLLVIRFIALYAAAIESREITDGWLSPATARTSGKLLIILTGLLALLFVTPLLTGDSDGSLTRLGVLGLGAVALGSTPYIASCVIGVRAVYSGSFSTGDSVSYGGQRGRVLYVGLYDVLLADDEGAEIRVPHLMSLWKATRIMGRHRALEARDPQ